MQWFIFNEQDKTYIVKSGEISYMAYDRNTNRTDIVLTGGPWVKVTGDMTIKMRKELKQKYNDTFTTIDCEES